MAYIHVWFSAYVNPYRFARELAGKPAPLWGLLACLQRALMDGFLLYLPLALMGRVPPERSYLSSIADERYYLALVGIAPIVLTAEWLLASAAMYLILRLARYNSAFDQVLNVQGFTALAIGAVLLVWDWVWLGLGGMSQYSLGISHLLIDLWGVAMAAIAFRVLLKVPVWLGLFLNVLGIFLALPMAIMFMRSPL